MIGNVEGIVSQTVAKNGGFLRGLEVDALPARSTRQVVICPGEDRNGKTKPGFHAFLFSGETSHCFYKTSCIVSIVKGNQGRMELVLSVGWLVRWLGPPSSSERCGEGAVELGRRSSY